jgi:hypothetical protein
LRELFDELGSDAGSRSANIYHRTHLAADLVTELRRHLVLEEQFLLPVIGLLLPDAGTLVECETTHRSRLEVEMQTLAESDPADNRFDPAVTQLFTLIAGHINRQEVDMFPRLRTVAEPDQLSVPDSHPSTERLMT